MVSTSNLPKVSRIRWCSLPSNGQRPTPPSLERNTWVQLLKPLTPYCHSEALLLCPLSDSQWVAWIPDHGETILNLDQVCLLAA